MRAVLTHDSIGLGEDGPTHQPVEQLASFRAMPNTLVIRPAGGNETAGAYKVQCSALRYMERRLGSLCVLTGHCMWHGTGALAAYTHACMHAGKCNATGPRVCNVQLDIVRSTWKGWHKWGVLLYAPRRASGLDMPNVEWHKTAR